MDQYSGETETNAPQCFSGLLLGRNLLHCCGMTGTVDAKKCRERAKRCLAQARKAPTLLIMTKFEGLAHAWLRLADELESIETMLRRLKKPERKAG